MKTTVRRLLVATLMGSLAIAAVSVFPATAVAGSANHGGPLQVLGLLPDAPPAGHQVVDDGIVGVDPSSHRLYYLWRSGDEAPNAYYLREYDLRPAVPTVVRDIKVGVYGQGPGQVQIDKFSPYFAAVNARRHELYILAQAESGPYLVVVDLRNGKVKSPIQVGQQLPGFVAEGITYSASDDRVYLIGSMMGSYVALVADSTFGGALPAAVPTVVAANPRTDAVQWAYPVRQCQKVLDTAKIGALIARSSHERVLYFACTRGVAYPGESGIVRLDLPKSPSQQHLDEFHVSYFGISGAFSGTGIAGFDQKSDRFFMQSLAYGSPGAWVFDGKLQAWVGQIAAPDSGDKYMGLNQGSGHYYMASFPQVPGQKAYLTVADGRATPVPQGAVVEGLNSHYKFITTDPGSDRLFASMDLGMAGLGKDGEYGWVVVQDRTPNQPAPHPLDYDALTSSVPEGPHAVTNFSGDVNGYGARSILIGGGGGATSFPFSGGKPPVELDSYDRGITASFVPSVDLRASGASATAQAALIDAQTGSQYQATGGPQAPAWPWAPVTCLNTGGDAVGQQTGDGSGLGQGSVTCDLSNGEVKASGSFGRISSSGLGVASSSFESTIQRTDDRGIQTHTSSGASGISISTPSGTVTIAHVGAVVDTVAHGHPGTTEATWRRVLSGIEIDDGSGTPQSIPQCETTIVLKGGAKTPRVQQDTCRQVAAQINDALAGRARIDLFQPDLQATPRGAFAGVQQSDAEYFGGRTVNSQGVVFANENPTERPVPALQLTMYNDGTEHSRALLQLAAIQASSIYTVSALGAGGPLTHVTVPPTGGGGGAQAAPRAAGPLATGQPGTVPAALGAPQQPTTTGVTSPAGSLAFLIRTPKEALLTAATLLLFAGAALSLARRRALLAVLTRKES